MKISAIAVVALIVLAAVAMVVVGGEHGPSRHLPGGAAVGKTAGP